MPANRYELMATWYLRFNGYFTTPDFTVHPDYRKRRGGTDADVLAIRFPFSVEYQRRFDFTRDESLILPNYIDFLICEVKAGICCINDTWLNQEMKNVQYVVRWMGFEEYNSKINEIAKSIYETGSWKNDQEKGLSVRFICIGNRVNDDISRNFPTVSQKLHNDVISYLRRRFKTCCNQITRENWDADIIWFAENCINLSNDNLIKWANESIK